MSSFQPSTTQQERAAPDGKVVISLSRSLVEPFLTFSARRDLREKAWRAWTTRGELDPKRDNLRIAREILSLRKAQSGMHGYPDFSQFKTADSMAGTPTAVSDLLLRVWEPAKKSAARERQALEDFLTETGGGVESLPDGLQPWDWRFYAEQVRVNKYALDEAEIKPYFSLEAMTTAMFDCAERLFGLRFLPISGAKTYHPDVQVYEVRERFQKCANGQADGQDTGGTGDNTTTNEMESGRNAKREDRLVGVFFHDNYCRPFKNSGAWMSELRGQTKNRNPARNAASLPAELTVPVVTNNNNFAKGGEGEPTLLTFDDARTLFHEFGHGLHGLLSNVSYSRLAGTNVLTDFVELPSQLFEHWLSEPEVLKKHARHYRTGEAIPDDLLDKLKAAERFNQGFSTVEYTSSALLDQALHTASVPPQPEKPESIILPAHRSDEDAPEPIPLLELDISAFERDYLDKLGMPQGMVPRHRPAHFAHLFSTSMYASAYYVYMWAQVLDADAFDAFKETSIFDAATAARVRKFIYSAGNSDDPAKLYRGFRGRDPKVEPLMKKLGLMN
jgi:peptidyl-dipeptidase Dcp